MIFSYYREKKPIFADMEYAAKNMQRKAKTIRRISHYVLFTGDGRCRKLRR